MPNLQQAMVSSQKNTKMEDKVMAWQSWLILEIWVQILAYTEKYFLILFLSHLNLNH
jgi:hypothetical protein